MDHTLAVVGTAGRRDDAERLTRAHYEAMYAEVLGAMQEWGIRALASGGAAWADHLAVRAFLARRTASLTLFLPAAFDGGRFVVTRGDRRDPGWVATYYHRRFSEACGIDSLGEIAQAIRLGATVEVHPGFGRRDAQVAAACTHMIAFTFGKDRPATDLRPGEAGFADAAAAGLKPGGTAQTWNMCQGAAVKRHVSLTALERALRRPAEPIAFHPRDLIRAQHRIRAEVAALSDDELLGRVAATAERYEAACRQGDRQAIEAYSGGLTLGVQEVRQRGLHWKDVAARRAGGAAAGPVELATRRSA